MGFPAATGHATRLGFWKLYLRVHGLPETDIIGDGLPDALRDRQGSEVMGAAALNGLKVETVSTAENAGPSTAVFRAALR